MKINSVCISSKQRRKKIIYTKVKKIFFMHLNDSYNSYYDRGIRGRGANVMKRWALSVRK